MVTIDVRVIHQGRTGHELAVREINVLGTAGVEIVTDIIAGDRRHSMSLTASEMDALCRWWMTKEDT